MKKALEKHLCWVASHRGLVRSDNEDAWGVSEVDERSALLEWCGVLPGTGGWALLADGMGGHAAGAVASQLAIDCIREEISSCESAATVTVIVNAVHLALHDVMARHPDTKGMGTTLAGVLLRSGGALAFNVGDSRIYKQAGGRLLQISTDHRVGDHILTQCLGGFDEEASISPEIREVALMAGERLLLCTDGLSDMVNDDQINLALSAGSSNPARSLVNAALQAGGLDNVTAIVIQRGT